jgi:hypothetical protein
VQGVNDVGEVPVDPSHGRRPSPYETVRFQFHRFTARLRRFGFDRRSRIALVMALIATLGAATAYRASEEELKSSTCERKLSEAETYQLVQRQTYLNAAVEHQRWSESYDLHVNQGRRYARQADILRETTVRRADDPDAAVLDVDAQLEFSIARTINPVREFTLPGLDPAVPLEKQLRARSKQDLVELGIANRCSPSDIQPSVANAAGPDMGDDYLAPVRVQVELIHRKSVQDSFAVAAFVLVLALFTLSEVFEGHKDPKTGLRKHTRTRTVFEILAIAAIPVAVFNALRQSDDRLGSYFAVAVVVFLGAGTLVWMVIRWMGIGHKLDSVQRTALQRDATTVKRGRGDTIERFWNTQNLEPYVSARLHTIERWAIAAFAFVVLLGAVFPATWRDVHLRWPFFTLLALVMLCIAMLAWSTISWRRIAELVRLHTHVQQHPDKTPRDAVAALAGVRREFNVIVGTLTLMTITFGFLVAMTVRVLSRGQSWFVPFAVPWVGTGVALIYLFFAVRLWLRTDTTERGSGADHEQQFHEEPGDPPEPVYRTESSFGQQIHLRFVQDRFSRIVVGCIGVTALLSAFAGYLYAKEQAGANEAAARAAQQQLALLRSTTRQEIVAYQAIDAVTLLREARFRAVAARELRGAAGAGTIDRASATIWDREAQRWNTASDHLTQTRLPAATRDLGSVPLERVFDDAVGPYEDATFPQRLFRDRTVHVSARQLAMWDAYDERSAGLDAQSSALLGTVTMLSIALYLFGQALGMGPTSRGAYVLAIFGIGLVAGGGIVGIRGFLQPVPAVEEVVTLPAACSADEDVQQLTLADAAATCYARAETLAQLANDGDDGVAAQDAYAAATTLREGFAIAYYRAARAASRFATPQLHTDHVSIVAAKPLERMVDQERRAVAQLQVRERILPGALVDGYGFHEYLLAIAHEGRGLLDHAMSTLERGSKFHMAVTLLAKGDDRNAINNAYWEALHDDDRDERTRAAAISDIEVVRAACTAWTDQKSRCESINDVGKSNEEVIVTDTWRTGGVLPTKPPDAGPAVQSTLPDIGLGASLAPGFVRWWFARPPQLAGLRDPMVLLVFRKDPGWNAFYLLPEVSGRVDASEIQEHGGYVNGVRQVVMRESTAQCLQPNGEYRVELHSGGRRIGHQTMNLPASPVRFASTVLREQGVALCYPSGDGGWTREPASTQTLSTGYRSRDDAAGARVFAFLGPRTGLPFRTRNERAAIRRAVDLTLDHLERHGIAGRGFAVAKTPCNGAFVNDSRPRSVYRSTRTSLFARAWSTADGLINVGVVWHANVRGTSDADALSCAVLSSMSPVDANVPLHDETHRR